MKKQKISDVVAVTILLFLLSVIVYNYLLTDNINNEIDENSRYTIGITGNSFGARHGSTVEYFYKVNNIEYRETQTKIKGVVNPAGKYIVQFSSLNPKRSRILFELEVSNYKIKVPDSGWDCIPDGVNVN
ncbi:hypothetical protein [Labilibaculum manganireducens]|uniref:hypothetical protein n=1 Tax=Labilibaculum manganireducens TaxID=1940525 RepID=UPI0029F52504|nr:hypothetical protein [Labilibaculum manganireducens]